MSVDRPKPPVEDPAQRQSAHQPGNSGSPVYKAATGEVLGVINKVFVKKTKESAITSPSGITYAIPVKHVYALAEKHGITL